MTYRDQLFPWCIILKMPNLTRSTLHRFRSRTQAEECIKVLRRLNPDGDYEIVFDPIEFDTIADSTIQPKLWQLKTR